MLKGLDVTWTEQYRNYTIEQFGGSYEGGAGSWGDESGQYDGLGWGTLLYRLDESDVSAVLNASTSVSAAAPTSTSSAGAIIPSTFATSISTPVPTTSTMSTISASPPVFTGYEVGEDVCEL